MSDNITREQRWALAITIIALPLMAWFAICVQGWLLAGHIAFGLTIGLMIGMTKSSVVSTALPLLFTFAGGSVTALSTGTGRTTAALETLGIQLTGFGIGATIGLLVGVTLKKLTFELPLGKFKE